MRLTVMGQIAKGLAEKAGGEEDGYALGQPGPGVNGKQQVASPARQLTARDDYAFCATPAQ